MTTTRTKPLSEIPSDRSFEQRETAENRTHDQVARLAYELWLARNPQEGAALDDWLEAERLLRKGIRKAA